MRKRIKKTGEIVEVVNYKSVFSEKRNDDFVTYVDSNGFKHENVKLMNVNFDFEDVPKNEPSDNINWEERRYEIAKSMLAAFLSNSCSSVYGGTYERQVKDAVQYADALIAELKNIEQ